jgi:hypothetical protein
VRGWAGAASLPSRHPPCSRCRRPEQPSSRPASSSWGRGVPRGPSLQPPYAPPRYSQRPLTTTTAPPLPHLAVPDVGRLRHVPGPPRGGVDVLALLREGVVAPGAPVGPAGSRRGQRGAPLERRHAVLAAQGVVEVQDRAQGSRGGDGGGRRAHGLGGGRGALGWGGGGGRRAGLPRGGRAVQGVGARRRVALRGGHRLGRGRAQRLGGRRRALGRLRRGPAAAGGGGGRQHVGDVLPVGVARGVVPAPGEWAAWARPAAPRRGWRRPEAAGAGATSHQRHTCARHACAPADQVVDVLAPARQVVQGGALLVAAAHACRGLPDHLGEVRGDRAVALAGRVVPPAGEHLRWIWKARG